MDVIFNLSNFETILTELKENPHIIHYFLELETLVKNELEIIFKILINFSKFLK